MPIVAIVVAVIVGILIVAGLIVLSAIIGLQFWNWFLIPLGLPTISIAHMVGISATISYFFPRPQDKDDNENKVGNAIIRALAPILTAFIASLFM